MAIEGKAGAARELPAPPTPVDSAAVVYRFAQFELCRERYELRRDGQPLAAEPGVLEVLAYLIAHRERVVPKQELLDALWRQEFDSEAALTRAVREARRLLGDTGAASRWIKTVYGRGFGWNGEVEEVVEPVAAPAPVAPAAAPAPRASVAAPAPRIGSLAVLPLENLSGDPDQEYFADGITDALINEFARISSLKVISRTSSMRYKRARKPLPEIGRELGVEAVVDGSVQRAGERVRVHAQLLRRHRRAPVGRALRPAAGGRAGAAERAGAGDRRRGRRHPDPPRAGAHRPSAAPSRPRRLPPRARGAPRLEPPHRAGLPPGAREVRAGARPRPRLRPRLGRPRRLPQHAGQLRHRATARGPRAGAPGGRAGARARPGLRRGAPRARPDALELRVRLGGGGGAVPAGGRARPQLLAGALLARRLPRRAGSLRRELRGLARARELDPLALHVVNVTGWMHYHSRRYAESLPYYEQVLTADGQYLMGHWLLGEALVELGEAEAGVAALERTLALSGGAARFLGYLGYAYGRTGREDDARRMLDRLAARRAERYVPLNFPALVHAGLGAKEEALATLEAAWEERDTMLRDLKVDPPWDLLHGEPRYVELLGRLGLAPG